MLEHPELLSEIGAVLALHVSETEKVTLVSLLKNKPKQCCLLLPKPARASIPRHECRFVDYLVTSSESHGSDPVYQERQGYSPTRVVLDILGSAMQGDLGIFAALEDST